MVNGGTAVWAEAPSFAPNYIFPFVSSAYFTNPDLPQFQYLMYRPLYWFSDNGKTALNNSLSVANPPIISGNNVTITLKHYMWSNGTPVTAQDVVFWLNMMLAVPQDWAGQSGFPANVRDIKAVSSTTLTMTMDKAYSPTWFLYNDLSQITPMPAAWDRTASGPSHCDTTVGDCAAVYNYLNAQAMDLTTYASSPLWSIVDGPWKLSAFNADGHVTFVPNKSYSGPIKPKLAAFEEVPFTTDAAEYDVLQSPSSSTKIDVGYLPTQDAPAKPANKAVGANPLASKGYTLAPMYPWGINFYSLNFQSSISDHAAIFRQLYFRQALAYLTNQAAVIAGPLRGYGDPTVGPVPSTPVTGFLSAQGKQGDPFPYNPAKAKSLLTSHGWKVVPNGVTTCVKPGTGTGECGSGITAASGLSFNFPYASGTSWLASEMAELQSNAASIGIKLNLEPKPLNEVLSSAGSNCVVNKFPCSWDMVNVGTAGSWTFIPDYLPTGEALFMSGTPANGGGYTNPTNDALINSTLSSANPQYLYQWQDYLAKQLPAIWQPNPAASLTEIANNLKGVTPQSPTFNLNPENWYFVK